MSAPTLFLIAFLSAALATPLLAKDIDNTKGGAPAAPSTPAAPAADESAAASAVAQRFYDAYVNGYLRAKGKKAPLGAWIAARPELTPMFKRLFAQADAKAKRSEMGGWDADPIINAQDFPDDGGMLAQGASVNGLRATVTMNWQRGMDQAVKVTLLRFPEGWRIHGIGGLVAK